MSTHTAPAPALSIRALTVELPGGHVLLDNLSLDVGRGEIVAILGGSGSGKSTLTAALMEPERLLAAGFAVRSDAIEFADGQLALVPQRGALFDHLTVGGNIELALRHAADSTQRSAVDWLRSVDMDEAALAARTGTLSGGQAQRVAVARALAGGRTLMLLDEPSVGLDPLRVRQLAELVRDQARNRGASAVVITHDVAFAADIADRLLVLDPQLKALRPLLPDWPGPQTGELRNQWISRVDTALVEVLGPEAATGSRPEARNRPWQRLGRSLVRPFHAAGAAILSFVPQLARHPRDVGHIFGRVLKQALLRPLLFYAVVSTLIGYTVLYVISRIGGAGVLPDALVRQIGGSYVVALAPALSAILFTAASGSATNAWLGSMALTRQTAALRALGVHVPGYLWSPTFFGVATAYFAVAVLFAAGMVTGGLVVCWQYDMTGSLDLLTADFFDPRPERLRYAVRAGFLVWVYGWGIAADVVGKGSADKADADAVTRAMTASVVACTLWIVAWELVSVMFTLAA